MLDPYLGYKGYVMVIPPRRPYSVVEAGSILSVQLRLLARSAETFGEVRGRCWNLDVWQTSRTAPWKGMSTRIRASKALAVLVGPKESRGNNSCLQKQQPAMLKAAVDPMELAEAGGRDGVDNGTAAEVCEEAARRVRCI